MSKYLSRLLVGSVILTSFILALNASFQESATMDELAHIPAGYGYVKYLDFRLNPEHPPLVKALAAFPLLFFDLNFPTDKSSWQTDINGQWAAGAQFLYESDNDADKIIRWARLGPMLLTLILIIFIYIWAKELIGRWWALLPTFLFAFSPNILAHGHYVTTDIGAALGIFISIYYFVKFLHSPSRNRLLFAGLAFGAAQLMKFSAVLLIPFLIFLIAVFYLWKLKTDWPQTAPLARFKRFSIRALRYLKGLFIVFAVGYVLVFVVYAVFTINYPIEKQIADTKSILTSFADGPDPEWKTCGFENEMKLSRKIRCLAEINIWMSGNKILRPLGQYMLGVLMVMQRSAGGNTGYFFGEVSAAGWWYYFPALFLLKEPVPSLILIFLALLLSVLGIIKKFKIQSAGWRIKFKIFWDYLGTHFAEFSMISFVIFYWAYSVKSPLNIGVRHILPTIPFIYILSTGAIKRWINNFELKSFIADKNFLNKLAFIMKNLTVIFLKSSFLTVLLIWYAAETFINSPYYLSYFNQFGGGREFGYEYAVDSNYDWGQDLKRLKKFVEKNNIEKIGVDYFGGGNPEYYLKNKAERWWSAKGNPKIYGIDWLAVSVNALQSALGTPHPGFERNPEDEYQWLQKIKDPYKPDAKAGTSIFIYKIGE